MRIPPHARISAAICTGIRSSAAGIVPATARSSPSTARSSTGRRSILWRRSTSAKRMPQHAPPPPNEAAQGTPMDPTAAQSILMYFVLPLWVAAGFADYLCHRAAHIEDTSGPKESVLHLLQFAEMAVPTLAAIFLEVNALIIL